MKMILRLLVLTIIILLSLSLGWWIRGVYSEKSLSVDQTGSKVEEYSKPLKVYSIENLKSTIVEPGNLYLKDTQKDNEYFSSYIFEFKFLPNPEKSDTKITTGLINIPKKEGSMPIIIMIRGYVDQKLYQSGMGTKRAGEYFAEHGFITIAPDFLGYGDSDKEAGNIFESRFQTYTTVLSLLRTLQEIPNDNKLLKLSSEIVAESTLADKSLNNFSTINIWAHSNGGQIALTDLVITGNNYPTVLWAPVTKPFPYSVLFYTDEAEDRGKLIRSELADFEKLYDVDEFSFTNYLNDLTSPIQIHQGTADDAVPYEWNQNFFTLLKKDYKDRSISSELNLYLYPGSDHDLQPSWDTVVERDVTFFCTQSALNCN